MDIRCYTSLPDAALQIRIAVFVDEQGFVDEFDDVDAIADHLVLYDGDNAVGTCRVFSSEKADTYILGRLCVLQSHRHKKCGSALLTAAEQRVRERGGAYLKLHSQCQAQGFYERQGYVPCSEIEDEQGCPHIWMKKEITQ